MKQNNKNSFVLYTDINETLQYLDNEEKGIIFQAILDYQITGEVPDLPRDLLLFFSTIKTDLDKNDKKYTEVVNARREAGKKGGKQTKQNKQNEANEANATFAYESKQNKQTQANEADNDNEYVNDNDNEYVNESSKDDKPPKSPKGGKGKAEDIISKYDFSPDMRAVIMEWLQYKSEKRQSYKPTGLNNLVAEIFNNVKRYGEAAVSDVMRKSMAAGYQGITWNWLKEGKFNDNIRNGAKSREPTSADISNEFNFEGWGEFT